MCGVSGGGGGGIELQLDSRPAHHRHNHLDPSSIVSADDLSAECSRIATRRYSHRLRGDGLEAITFLLGRHIQSMLRALRVEHNLINENALLQRQFLVRIVLQLIREAVRSDRGGGAVNASGCNAMTPFLVLLLTSEMGKGQKATKKRESFWSKALLLSSKPT